MSRGRLSNHLYLLGATPADATTGHGPPTPALEPTDAVRQALHQQSEQRLAIDSGDPVALWPIEDLVAERHRLVAVLAACPPDRSHDIAALTARHQQVGLELEPLVSRYNELAERKLRGPGTRTEMRELRAQVGALSEGFERLATELGDAHSGMSARGQFQADHGHDAGRLDAVDSELSRQLDVRARQIAGDPSEYHLRILGQVPAEPEHLTIWLRGAAVLERHRLGLDHDPSRSDSSSLFTPRDRAEMLARLEVMAIPRRGPELERTIEPDHGIGLF